MFCIAQRRLWQTFAQKAINITYYNININTNRFISFYHTLKKNEESPIKLLFLWRKKRKLMRVFFRGKSWQNSVDNATNTRPSIIRSVSRLRGGWGRCRQMKQTHTRTWTCTTISAKTLCWRLMTQFCCHCCCCCCCWVTKLITKLISLLNVHENERNNN